MCQLPKRAVTITNTFEKCGLKLTITAYLKSKFKKNKMKPPDSIYGTRRFFATKMYKVFIDTTTTAHDSM